VEEKDEGIYGSIIAVRRRSIKDEKDVRSYCIDEIVETEVNYVNHLEMMCSKFIRPLKSHGGLSEKDAKIIFINTEELLPVHKGFLEMVRKYRTQHLSKAFIEHKEKFLLYGTYCGLLAEGQEHLDILMKHDAKFKSLVEELQDKASPNKFRLRELMCVPMQRVLKYQLLVKELNKHTSESSSDKQKMGKALEEMQELSHYINEVKRDTEMNLTISKVQACLVGFSDHMLLNAYGRLLKDGELKVKVANEKNKPKMRNVFLFDQALIMTKEDNGKYNLKDNLRLEEENFTIDDSQHQRGSKWSHSWSLHGRINHYQLFAKTECDKLKWIEFIGHAFDNISPSTLKNKPYKFCQYTFTKPTYCDVCQKLLLGTFFQGYFCNSHNVKSHKGCLSDCIKRMESGTLNKVSDKRFASTSSLDAPDRPPRGPKQERPKSASNLNSSRSKLTVYKAHRDYKGFPSPPFSGVSISFEVGEQIQVDEIVNNDWWRGCTMSVFETKGYFPASFVSPVAAERRSSAVLSKEFTTTTTAATAVAAAAVTVTAVTNPASVGLTTKKAIHTFNWFAGELDRMTAESYLKGRPTGTFLVRVKDKNTYAVSLVFEDDIKHIRLWRSAEGSYYLTECKHFRSLQELIGFYERNTMATSFLGLETTLRYAYRTTSAPTPAQHPPSSQPRRSLPSFRSGAPESPRNSRSCGRVLYDFDPRSEPEIGLKIGQFVTIVSKKGDSHGWWKVECEGKVGYVPASFIEEIN